MSWITTLIGTATSTGAGAVLAGLGTAAKDLREAITGELPADKRAEIELKIKEFESSVVLAQSEINKIEAQSSNLFIAGWRPFIGWVCGLAFAWQFVGGPFLTFALTSLAADVKPPYLDMADLLPVLLGMLGLGGLRTFEKVKNAEGNR